MARRLIALMPVLAVSLLAQSPGHPASGLTGDWREPGGSVIRVASCGADVCARLIQISAQAASRTDGHNPDTAKRSRQLCGLEIGTSFQPNGPDHADNGRLYDPKTGKTYHGEMASEGDTLHLRGFVGIRAFGRTEDWSRVNGGLKTGCS